ncbi:MAG: xanthine dehydrogenase family protein subunit M [Saccharofermentanales bacterium]|nr:xanthine dehydrogenase family protein subunit M [Eubacteriales bacterium]MDD3611641.1 xanthine dehydrogenase family protein subunit M [Eubacteriales bacterium]HHU04343.1 xanthine dehydrogenase family protein subunit M [Fastidiosipila sp.]
MLSKFDYAKPLVLEEALDVLSQNDGGTYILAGGTDLLIALRHNLIDAKHIIDIKSIPELDVFEFVEGEGLEIGANVVCNALIESEIVKEKYTALYDAATVLATYPLRNRATLVGNICNGSPGADLPPALLIYDATVKIASADGVRTVPLQEFFTGVKKTQVADNEMVVSVFLPDPVSEKDRSCYARQTRLKGHDLSTVGVACRINGDGKAAIGINAVAITPLRLTALEDELNEKGITEDSIDWAAEEIQKHIKPISDVRASKEYRLHMASVLLKRGLTQLKEKEA